MGLTNKKEEQLKRMPVIETSIMKSKDGKFLVHKTTITTIKPIQYYEAILSGEKQEFIIEDGALAEV